MTNETLSISGTDCVYDATQKRITPINGVFHVQGVVRSPYQLVTANWEVDGASGSTTCEAWKMQHTIDELATAGYNITSIDL